MTISTGALISLSCDSLSLELYIYVQDSQTTPERQSNNQVSHESQSDQQNNNNQEAPVPDSGSAAVSSNDGRKVSREDIELVRQTAFVPFWFLYIWKMCHVHLEMCDDLLQVQNLIERCLQLYMNRDEVVKTLLNRARIDPGFTTLGRICDQLQILEMLTM